MLRGLWLRPLAAVWTIGRGKDSDAPRARSNLNKIKFLRFPAQFRLGSVVGLTAGQNCRIAFGVDIAAAQDQADTFAGHDFSLLEQGR